MFERFTEAAREVVVAAVERSDGATVDLPALWLALLGGGGRGPAVLTGAGVDLDRAAEVAAAARDTADGPITDVEVDALADLGIDVAAVRASVEASFGPGALDRPAAAPRGWFRRRHAPFGPAARKVLELALREAIALRQRELDTTHLLLGLVRADPALAARVAPGAALDTLRALATESGR
ncbi:hypothetical protein GCM10010124_27210 [Pilimelia terevasa]|uniref:Clp R domain-containing protein n=1 Tax=Pilimelia terevasa TaxID=53372 RepID=A0A8J3FKE9_9ACTN|nr:Clp protease N-terminal domain-containing protein [Pilimelia terevasa]GGK33041.1 hypothetical protein GCM10010124_27210 [Pilimelia terevasa]